MCLKSDILKYESKIWSTCDTLRGAGVKQSEFPQYMMPFFVLRMVEARLITMVNNLIDEGYSTEEIREELQDSTQDFSYNEHVMLAAKGEPTSIGTLADICEVQEGFDEKFADYLNDWDDNTKLLLGLQDTDALYLDIPKYIKSLKSKGRLRDYTSKWAEIDLRDYDASDITTLEEHIKRKWADISAATSGEQYTPDDIIDLVAAIQARYAVLDNKKSVTLYDMTCGGGNMLFGSADKIKKRLPNITTSTYGQEINDSLYALAKIESRFRTESGGGAKHVIEHGDTLANDKFIGKEFDFISANPPYGIDWKDSEKDVIADETGRFVNTGISRSDGQLLFMQHAVSKLKSDGKAVIVHNGSPMFTGDVNSAESQVRKWLLDNDWIEAWVQLPKEEFFNTQITTYLWVINKNKPADRKDKIILINASEKFSKLKKSMGKKTNKMDSEHIDWVMDKFDNPVESDDVKFLSKYDFYYNKQQLTLIERDDDGKAIYDILSESEKLKGFKKLKKVSELKVYKEGKEFVFKTSDGSVVEQITSSVDGVIFSSEMTPDKEFVDSLKEVFTASDLNVNDVYHSSVENQNIVFDKQKSMGRGFIVPKLTLGKKSGKSVMKLSIELKADLTKDYEIIPHLPGEENEKSIQAFLDKWVRKEYILGDNSVGVEVNFNKVFYKPVVLRSTKEIADDIKAIDVELAELEKELWG
ncbi:N-6 DNA methylase [Vibrio fluvialis]|nr:N-6 DNA methylase [Vibrio fluvialis]